MRLPTAWIRTWLGVRVRRAHVVVVGAWGEQRWGWRLRREGRRRREAVSCQALITSVHKSWLRTNDVIED